MRCSSCLKREASYLVFEDVIMPLCQECFDEYARLFGEMNLTFWEIHDLENPSYLEGFIETINNALRSWQDGYRLLLMKYTELLKKADKE